MGETYNPGRIVCPNCGHTQWDDVWEYQTDDVWTCPECEEKATLEVDTTTWYRATPKQQAPARGETAG